MRILVAPQEFKGSLTAAEAARAIAAGVRDATPAVEIDEAPMSDGGPGFVDAMLASTGGARIEATAHDPLMRPIRAAWALLADGVAVIEMAAASGLTLLSPHERNPLIATTFGTGELIRAALDRGCATIILGIGGSATVDAGAGAIQALGARLLDDRGDDLPPGGAALARLARVDPAHVDARLAAARMRVASDVTSTLCGPNGAATMFGPQKGASQADVLALEAALLHFAEIVARDLGIDVLSVPGSGAAGGLGAGLIAVAGATIEPGFAIVAEALHLEERIAAADLVITGEGRLDDQTALGKTAAAVARLARLNGKRVVAIAGSLADGFDPSHAAYDAVIIATPDGMSIDTAMRDAAALVRAAAARVV